MPKQIKTGTGVKIILDASNPKDKVKIKEKEHKDKALTQKEKAEMYDLYVEAGVIST